LLNETVFSPVSAGETTLVVGLTEDTVSLDPARAYEFHAFTVNQGLYETLVTFPSGQVGEVVPALAESWTISEDGLTYTFTLKGGHTFSTGRTVTAADVAFSINRVRHLKGNPSFLADTIANVEAPDELTVVITLNTPDPALLSKLVLTTFGALDSEEAKANGATDAEDAATADAAEEWLNSNSIGSGPYMLQKWEPKVEVILVRNPNYVGTPAQIDRVIFRTISDAAAQKLALEAGDLDIALDISADQVPSLKSNSAVTVYEGLSDTVFFLIMNTDPAIGGPLADDRVQDAVRLALDYEGLRLLVGGAAATPVNIMPVHWVYALDPAQGIQRNLEAAKAKLAEAGFADGLTVELEYPEFTSGGVAIGTLAQKVQADLAEAGINVQLKPGDIGVTLENYRNGKESFGLWLWGPDFLDPLDRLAFTPGGKVGVRVNWGEEDASAELVQLVKQAQVATDPAERAEVFMAIQQRSLDESPFAFLVQSGVQVAYNANLQGFTYTSGLWRINPYTMSK
jgi:peptide/nickel transport system substrate-binding protein